MECVRPDCSKDCQPLSNYCHQHQVEAFGAVGIVPAEIWKRRFEWLASQHWVETEATFRLELPETDSATKYMNDLTTEIDKQI